MSMMSDIAGLSVSMHAAQLQQSVSISIAKSRWTPRSLPRRSFLQMLPAQPGVGEHINTCANANGEVRRRTSPDIFIKKSHMAPFFSSPLGRDSFFIVRLRRERRLRIGGLLFAHSRVEHLLPHPVHFLHTVEINGREQVCRYSQRFRVFRNLLPICLLIAAYDPVQAACPQSLHV